MRRTIAIGSLVLLLLGLAVPAQAQPALMGPGGVLNSSGASVTISNSAADTVIYAYAVPAGFYQRNFAPLHVRLLGRLSTNVATGAVGAVNVGCNFGGSTASIAVVNAVSFTQNLSNVPFQLDLWIVGASSTQANGIQQNLSGRFGIVQSAGTETVHSAQVDGTTSPNLSSQQILCTWKWSSAATTNSVSILNGKTVVGE